MAYQQLLLKGRMVTPNGISCQQELMEIKNGSISFMGESGTIFPGPEHHVYDFGANYICPGFIDLHVHGSGGADVMDGTPEALNTISLALAQGGTTGFLATTMSVPRAEMAKVLQNIAFVKKQGTKGATIVGAHLEGPFLNPGKKGAQLIDNLRLPNVKELKEYIDAGNGTLKMITLAPELPGALEVITLARSHGLIVSLGHSVATISHVEEACKAGLSHVSHAFNAMGALHHRDPGTIGAIMSMKQLTVDIIPDGIHVHPSVIKILVHAKGIDQVCSITDCIRAGNMGDGVFELGGQTVLVRDGVARLEDGKTLSGSIISMAQTVKVMVEEVGLSLLEAVQLASANPAKFLGLSSKGFLEVGNDADIVVLDHKFRVLMTIVAGKVVYNSYS